MLSQVLRRSTPSWFKMLDTDGNGSLDKAEFGIFLVKHLKLKRGDADEMICKADANGDDVIDAKVMDSTMIRIQTTLLLVFVRLTLTPH